MGTNKLTEYKLANIKRWLAEEKLIHPMYVIVTKHPDPEKAIEDLCSRSLAGEDFACLIRELARTLE